MAGAFAVVFTLAVAGCGFFGSGEAVKQDPGRAVYRAAEAPLDVPETTPVREEVPGEKRSRVP